MRALLQCAEWLKALSVCDDDFTQGGSKGNREAQMGRFLQPCTTSVLGTSWRADKSPRRGPCYHELEISVPAGGARVLPFAVFAGGSGGGPAEAAGAFGGLVWELECAGVAVDVSLSLCAYVGDRWVRVGWAGQQLTMGLASRLRVSFSGGKSAWPTLGASGGGDGGMDVAPLRVGVDEGAWPLER